MMRSNIAILLMRIKAERDISFYKMGQFGRISSPTMSKWFKPIGHKDFRNPTEEQVLKLAVSVAFDGEPPPWLRTLFESDDAEFVRGLDRRRRLAGLSWLDVADLSGVGSDRLAEIVERAAVAQQVVRLRLLAAAIFTPEQATSANEVLQAADRYVFRVPELPARRTA